MEEAAELSEVLDILRWDKNELARRGVTASLPGGRW